jgi:4-hydroxy-2-oxoheptanedioate aldolase
MTLKHALLRARAANAALAGLFIGFAAHQPVEALAGSGFDFFVFDLEHSPSALPVLHAQLAALRRADTVAAVRVPSTDAVAIKHVLDLGVDAIMVPDVRSAAQAREAVRAMRYPPAGARGMGGSIRATDFGRDPGYYARANREVCLIAQIESLQGLDALEDICAVDGVDVVFFGPYDLAADAGHLAQPAHPDIAAKVLDGLRRVRRCGRHAGLLAAPAQWAHYTEAGAELVILGSDVSLLVRAADALAGQHALRQRANPPERKTP